MSDLRRPPGPTWESESHRSLAERVRMFAQGTIPLIRQRFQDYGDLYFIDNGKAGTFVARHPDHLHEALVIRAGDFVKRRRDLGPFLGEGLLTSDGELWRRQRRLIQPAFRREKLEAYAQVMVDRTRSMVDGWSDGQVVDLGREMMKLTLSVVAKTLLNYDSSNDAEAVASAMAALQKSAAAPDIFPGWLPTPMHVRRKRANRTLDSIIYRLIDECPAEPDADHLLGQLKHASDEEGRMQRRQLRDELVTLFLAGHETTAQAMTWLFYLLSQNEDQEGFLHEEVDRVLNNRLPTIDDVKALEFTNMCFKEALRLFPPIYILPRVAARETVLGGFVVEPGAELILWVYLCHRDERWFPNPDAFIPARFLSESEGVRHPHAYYPFGAGPRQCIGIHFAMNEGMLLLAAIAQRYRLHWVDDGPVGLNPQVTLGSSRPIRMKLERR